MATAAEMKVRGVVLDVVDELEKMVEANPAFTREPDAGVTVRQINARLKLDRSSTWRRLKPGNGNGLAQEYGGAPWTAGALFAHV
jgi:hypothetical protein